VTIQWIRLADELPPPEVFVLIWVPSRPWRDPCATVFAKVARRTDGGQSGWKEWGPSYYNDVEITHWAYINLPDVPEYPK